ncbi:hypothetical protein KAU88_09545 [Candidatus Bathyarchaeota archaeon]|nr:hypothetical protein [Candidatus Bathyarchaeota archaeon]
MPVFVQLVSSFSTGRFDTEKDTTSINRILKSLQNKGAKILDVKLSFGSREHITTVVYLITYEARSPMLVHEKK